MVTECPRDHEAGSIRWAQLEESMELVRFAAILDLSIHEGPEEGPR
jgi:hypothetical protein